MIGHQLFGFGAQTRWRPVRPSVKGPDSILIIGSILIARLENIARCVRSRIAWVLNWFDLKQKQSVYVRSPGETRKWPPPKFGSKIAQLKVLYQNRTKNPKLGMLYPKRTDDTFDKQPWRRDMSMMVFSLRIGFDQKHTITSIYLTCCRTIMVFSAQHGHMKMHGQVGACFLGKKFKNWLISRATGGPKARSKLTFE